MNPNALFMLLHVRQPKTVLDSGFNALGSAFQLLDSGLFVYDYWIPDSNH